MKRSSKFKFCGIVSLVIGVILVGVGIGWPFLINGLIKSGAKQGAALTADNAKMWKGVPGNFNVFLGRKTHMYNCTNHDDVIYKGAKPIL
jgi:hypothetical protein